MHLIFTAIFKYNKIPALPIFIMCVVLDCMDHEYVFSFFIANQQSNL